MRFNTYLLQLIAFIILMFSSQANASEGKPTILISVPEIHVEALDEDAFFKEAAFDRESENIKFVTKEEVSTIQIYDHDGTLVFQLPVDSKFVRLNRRVFGDAGRYKLGFVGANTDLIKFANVRLR